MIVQESEMSVDLDQQKRPSNKEQSLTCSLCQNQQLSKEVLDSQIQRVNKFYQNKLKMANKGLIIKARETELL